MKHFAIAMLVGTLGLLAYLVHSTAKDPTASLKVAITSVGAERVMQATILSDIPASEIKEGPDGYTSLVRRLAATTTKDDDKDVPSLSATDAVALLKQQEDSPSDLKLRIVKTHDALGFKITSDALDLAKGASGQEENENRIKLGLRPLPES